MASWHAQAADDPLPSWNDGPAKQAIVEFVDAVTTAGGADFVAAGRADRHLRQRRHALGRAADLHPVRLRPRPGQGAGAASHPEWKTTQPFKAVLENDMRGAGRGRREGDGRAGRGDPCRHDHGRVHGDSPPSGWPKRGTPLQAALYRARLPADARGAGLSAGERLQDLHRLGRRHRLHAAVDRAGLRHPAGAGAGLLDQDPVRHARRRAGADAPARDRLRRRRARQAGRHRQAHRPPPDRRLRQFRRGHRRCCNGQPPGPARG